MPDYADKPLDLDGVKTYPLKSRRSKVTVGDMATRPRAGGSFKDFWDGLPNVLAARDLRDLVERMRKARREEHALLWGLGAHAIKVGLSPLLIELMHKGYVSGLALNGAGLIHDFEMALVGATSEDVDEALGAGAFGMAEETAALLNRAIGEGVRAGQGLGEAVGDFLHRHKPQFMKKSLLWTAYELAIPVTVHVAIGTDIIHMHPEASGEAIGKGSHQDFRLFASLVARLDGGGVYLNVGSAVILPEVFLKAVSLVRNLGRPLSGFSTANFDFIRHYRPRRNVVERPVAAGGRGFDFVGHHELLIPLMVAGLLESED